MTSSTATTAEGNDTGNPESYGSKRSLRVDASATKKLMTPDMDEDEIHLKIQELDREGKYLFKKQQYQDAADAFTEALELTDMLPIDDDSVDRQRVALLNNRSASYEKYNRFDLVLPDCDDILKSDLYHSKARTRKLRALQALEYWEDALIELCAIQLLYMDENAESLSKGESVPPPPVAKTKMDSILGQMLPKQMKKYGSNLKKKAKVLPGNYTILQMLKSYSDYPKWTEQAARDGPANSMIIRDTGDVRDMAHCVERLFVRGRRFVYEGEYKQALRDFERAYRLVQDEEIRHHVDRGLYVRLLEWLGMSRHWRYNLAGSMEAFRECSEFDSCNAILFVKQAVVQMDAGDDDEALRLFKRALGLDHRSVDTLYHRSHLFMLQSKRDEAKKDLEALLRINPHHGMARLRLASILSDQDDLKGALKQIDEAEKSMPKSCEVALCRGEISFARGNLLEARQMFEKGVDLEPTNPTSYANLAMVILEVPPSPGDEPDATEAVECLEKAISVDPMFTAAYTQLAQLKLGTVCDCEGAKEVILLHKKALSVCRSSHEIQELCRMRCLAVAQIKAAAMLNMVKGIDALSENLDLDGDETSSYGSWSSDTYESDEEQWESIPMQRSESSRLESFLFAAEGLPVPPQLKALYDQQKSQQSETASSPSRPRLEDFLFASEGQEVPAQLKALYDQQKEVAPEPLQRLEDFLFAADGQKVPQQLKALYGQRKEHAEPQRLEALLYAMEGSELPAQLQELYNQERAAVVIGDESEYSEEDSQVDENDVAPRLEALLYAMEGAELPSQLKALYSQTRTAFETNDPTDFSDDDFRDSENPEMPSKVAALVYAMEGGELSGQLSEFCESNKGNTELVSRLEALLYAMEAVELPGQLKALYKGKDSRSIVQSTDQGTNDPRLESFLFAADGAEVPEQLKALYAQRKSITVVDESSSEHSVDENEKPRLESFLFASDGADVPQQLKSLYSQRTQYIQPEEQEYSESEHVSSAPRLEDFLFASEGSKVPPQLKALYSQRNATAFVIEGEDIQTADNTNSSSTEDPVLVRHYSDNVSEEDGEMWNDQSNEDGFVTANPNNLSLAMMSSAIEEWESRGRFELKTQPKPSAHDKIDDASMNSRERRAADLEKAAQELAELQKQIQFSNGSDSDSSDESSYEDSDEDSIEDDEIGDEVDEKPRLESFLFAADGEQVPPQLRELYNQRLSPNNGESVEEAIAPKLEDLLYEMEINALSVPGDDSSVNSRQRRAEELRKAALELKELQKLAGIHKQDNWDDDDSSEESSEEDSEEGDSEEEPENEGNDEQPRLEAFLFASEGAKVPTRLRELYSQRSKPVDADQTIDAPRLEDWLFQTEINALSAPGDDASVNSRQRRAEELRKAALELKELQKLAGINRSDAEDDEESSEEDLEEDSEESSDEESESSNHSADRQVEESSEEHRLEAFLFASEGAEVPPQLKELYNQRSTPEREKLSQENEPAPRLEDWLFQTEINALTSQGDEQSVDSRQRRADELRKAALELKELQKLAGIQRQTDSSSEDSSSEASEESLDEVSESHHSLAQDETPRLESFLFASDGAEIPQQLKDLYSQRIVPEQSTEMQQPSEGTPRLEDWLFQTEINALSAPGDDASVDSRQRRAEELKRAAQELKELQKQIRFSSEPESSEEESDEYDCSQNDASEEVENVESKPAARNRSDEESSEEDNEHKHACSPDLTRSLISDEVQFVEFERAHDLAEESMNITYNDEKETTRELSMLTVISQTWKHHLLAIIIASFATAIALGCRFSPHFMSSSSLQLYERSGLVDVCGQSNLERLDGLEPMNFKVPNRLVRALEGHFLADLSKDDSYTALSLETIRNGPHHACLRNQKSAPRISTYFYKEPETVNASRQKSVFTSFAAKFVNLSPKSVLLFSDGDGSRGSKVIGQIAPFESFGVSVTTPGQTFSMTPTHDRSHALDRWAVTADEPVLYYEPSSDYSSWSEKDQLMYEMQKLNEEFGRAYRSASGRPWLGNFPRSFSGFMWSAEGDRHEYQGHSLEVVSAAPRVLTISNLLSASECRQWKSGRASEFSLRRAAALLKVDRSALETVIVSKFGAGEGYESRHNFVYPSQLDRYQSNRVATLFVFLNDDYEGGELVLSRTGETIKPEQGKAVLMYNMLPDGNVDDHAQHSGNPVMSGEKAMATLHVWDGKVPN